MAVTAKCEVLYNGMKLRTGKSDYQEKKSQRHLLDWGVMLKEKTWMTHCLSQLNLGWMWHQQI